MPVKKCPWCQTKLNRDGSCPNCLLIDTLIKSIIQEDRELLDRLSGR